MNLDRMTIRNRNSVIKSINEECDATNIKTNMEIQNEQIERLPPQIEKQDEEID